MESIANFILTEWIWSIAAGAWYITINILLLFLFLKLWDQLGWVRALSISILLTISSFLIFFGFVYGVCVKLLGMQFVLPEDTYTGSYNILNTSLILSGIFIVIQSLLLFIINKFTSVHYMTALLCVIASNLMTAFLVYKIMFNM